MLAEWKAVLARLRGRVGEHTFNAWIEPIHCVAEERGYRLEVGSPFFKDRISKELLDAIGGAFAEGNGAQAPELRVVVVERPAEPVAPAPPRRAPKRRDLPQAMRMLRIGRLANQYTFDRFVVGPSNELAYRAACAVAEGGTRTFNPLFVWGGVGLGKTHLISALAHRFLQSEERHSVAFLSAEEFMNQMILALRQDRMRPFRERFRELDLLIVDDVEFLAGKERTQEEFFHTFDALFAAGRQVVLTSDKPPQAIPDLARRLRSRFEGGLNVDVRPPTADTRLEIVRRKAADRNADLNGEVLAAIVERSGPSVRELEGALTRVLAWRDLADRPLDAAVVAGLLEPVARTHARISGGQVIAAVCRHFQVGVEEVRSPSRERTVSEARQAAMYLCRHLANMPYAAIGQDLGGRDHSTVIYAVRTVAERRKKDGRLDQAMAALEARLREAASRQAA